jgi:endonuclease G
MDEERAESLRTRLAQSPELAAAVRAALVDRAAPGPIEQAVTDEAREAVAADREPLERAVGVDTLEAIVQRVGRPPLLVRNDAVELEPLVDFPPGTDALVVGVSACIPSVGRVEFVNHRLRWGGTGWVVAADGKARVVATNRHVAKLVAQRTSNGAGVFLRSPSSGARYGMDIDFREEVGSGDASRTFTVESVTHLADDAAPDVALLRLVGEGLPDPLELAGREAATSDLVALIGYPAFDSRNDVDAQARYFRDLYDVKRFAPGRVMQPLSSRTTLTHDCTSLGGNSGSPLIRLDTGEVVGLHFAGVYGVANSAVGVGSLKRTLRNGSRPVVVAPQLAQGDGGAERADGHRSADDLADRAGYDPAFLTGRPLVPWPGLPAAVEDDLARPSDATADNPFELRYTHFGVQHSTSRRQAVMTAVNIDGEHAVRIKRTRDKWFSDGRLPAEFQLSRHHYDDPQIDRGHMVRREDPNWDPAAAGSADATPLAQQANDDTFHYTNAGIQHSAMNQGKDLWLGLEDYILDSARTEGFRACVFTGPVNREDDPAIADGVLAPKEFWKLVVMPDADGDGLHATAYVLSQGDLIRELLERRDRTEAVEGFELGAYRTFQVAVQDLADVTGYDFSAYLDADPLARAHADGGETPDAGAPLFVPLDRLEDVRLSPTGG